MTEQTTPRRPELQQVLEQQAARRARVLAQPDLAKRLTQPPFTYEFPEQWGGYIPPKTIERQGRVVENPSPQRKALIALLNDVLAAEQQQAARAAGTEPEPTDPQTLDPQQPGSVVPPQLKALHTLFSECGITDRDQRLAFCTEHLGREITTTKNLSRFEAPRLMTLLTRLIDPEEPPQ